ncbi:hypothetical protein OK348_14440 [Flavobacterium sp. MXW15]|uniref:HNH endonuclease n=1 Tax=Xanthomonas chitinilytica TaxID=2989819 RepID=A0ABT3JYM7_9XANT|nr:hypothetical protein [Xanthomonas sp. H13-6]MCW4455987.1 hypothetical protein [Flavobacterium sp. MXW15]MCW4473586.1 hypothetical protein [Xanthomonas sp. H13-6]
MREATWKLDHFNPNADFASAGHGPGRTPEPLCSKAIDGYRQSVMNYAEFGKLCDGTWLRCSKIQGALQHSDEE